MLVCRGYAVASLIPWSNKNFWGVTLPVTRRDQRPAPPAGMTVLTVPEAVQVAQDRAAERGDGRARLMPQDIWRDIKAGKFRLGEDAFWVTVEHHPKGGYWVLTPAAVDRRIQERLRGRGRPRKSPKAPAPSQSDIPEPLAVEEGNPEFQPVSDASSDVTNQVSAPVSSVGAPARSPSDLEASAYVVQPGLNRGHELFPVMDPARYRDSLAQALRGNGWLYLCRCGWAGPRDDFSYVPYEDGQGKYPVCPECGSRHGSDNIVYVSAAAYQLRVITREVQDLLGLTRNEKWRASFRRHQAHLKLLIRQAVLEEPLTPGVIDKVNRLLDQVSTLLDETSVLPAVMRTEPPRDHLLALTRPKVEPVLEKLFPVAFRGDVAPAVTAALQGVEAGSLMCGLLSGQIPPHLFWSALWRLRDTGGLHTSVQRLMSSLEVLANAAPADLSMAGTLEQDVNRRVRPGNPFYAAGRDWAQDDQWGSSRLRWERHRELAEKIHQVRAQVSQLLTAAAVDQVQAAVAAEVERMASLARAEARRTGRQSVEVVASWVRRKVQFSSVEMLRLVAYPLAQLLQSEVAEGERS